MKKLFDWIKELTLAILIIGVLLNVVSFIKSPNLTSKSLPNLKLTTTKGKVIDFSSYKNYPLILHFWATWCPTCKLEISNLETLSKKYQVLTIAVNSGDDKKINRFLKEHDLNFYVINDKDGKLASKFLVTSFPTTFIYDKNSKIKFTEVGYTSTLGLWLRAWLAN